MIRGDSSESEDRGSSYGKYRKRGRVTDLRQEDQAEDFDSEY
jgi:hypothetical protein